jgi:hypothetical protein
MHPRAPSRCADEAARHPRGMRIPEGQEAAAKGRPRRHPSSANG